MAGADFWDSRYEGDAFAYGEAPNAFLASLTFARGGRALVPGDGEGRNGVFLAERGLQVETLDLSPLGVAKARALATRRGVALDARVADVLAWDWPLAAYDVVALMYLHLPAAERRRLHASRAGGPEARWLRRARGVHAGATGETARRRARRAAGGGVALQRRRFARPISRAARSSCYKRSTSICARARCIWVRAWWCG